MVITWRTSVRVAFCEEGEMRPGEVERQHDSAMAVLLRAAVLAVGDERNKGEAEEPQSCFALFMPVRSTPLRSSAIPGYSAVRGVRACGTVFKPNTDKIQSAESRAARQHHASWRW